MDLIMCIIGKQQPGGCFPQLFRQNRKTAQGRGKICGNAGSVKSGDTDLLRHFQIFLFKKLYDFSCRVVTGGENRNSFPCQLFQGMA